MALITKELEIKSLDKLFELNLTLPSYQRPYRWSAKSTNTLFNDTYEAFTNKIEEYRLGTIILHREENKENGEKYNYNIVDGQQRLTTLSILLHHLGSDQNLLKKEYISQSKPAIIENSNIISKIILKMSNDKEKEAYKKYLLEQCTIVKIITDSEQEAFQFFDSQNSRGKRLAPHDLLKSYHLREMNMEDEKQKVKIINKWENINQCELDDLFKRYLYPVIQWYKGKDGLGYSSSKIDCFKGIKAANIYNFAIYHKSANLYVEESNANGENMLLYQKTLKQFQLTQPLIAGKRFFNYIIYYSEL